ncbi:hypothetical protein GOODEAATRI_009850, partial [Goodea atripinnis]
MFTSDDGIGSSGAIIIEWFYVESSGYSQKIYHLESLHHTVEKNTPYTDRLTVNNTGTPGEMVLTIRDVQLSDQVEFICHVKSLTDGTGEGRTQLTVFMHSVTTESSGLFSVNSVLTMKVKKEDKNAAFYCEAKYLVPGTAKMTETEHINITVY